MPFHADGGDAASDVAGERQDVVGLHQVNRGALRDLAGLFQAD